MPTVAILARGLPACSIFAYFGKYCGPVRGVPTYLIFGVAHFLQFSSFSVWWLTGCARSLFAVVLTAFTVVTLALFLELRRLRAARGLGTLPYWFHLQGLELVL